MTNFLPTVSTNPAWRGSSVWASNLLGEERPRNMLLLLAVLVLSLHLWLLAWLMSPMDEPLIEAKPLIMEVAMIAVPAPKKAVAPPAPPEKKTPPKPIQPKPIIKKPLPTIQKAADFAPSEPVVESPVPPQPTSGQSSASASTPQAVTASATDTFTEANFRANYAHNPKPEYPIVAKSRGWSGKVVLRVKVSVQGLSDEVAVEKSSGYDLLDDSAIEAVKQWRFIPAKRGETPVASSVLVPIVFNLRE